MNCICIYVKKNIFKKIVQNTFINSWKNINYKQDSTYYLTNLSSGNIVDGKKED